MRLLLIGSASIHTFRFLEGIASHATSVHFISNEVLPEKYCVANLGSTLILDFSFKAFFTAHKISKLIDELRPDIVHVHQANSVAWHARRALAGKNTPWLLTTWGSDVLLLPQKNWFMRRMVAENLAAASAVTSDSLYMAAKIRELTQVKHLEVINFGVDSLPAEIRVQQKSFNVLSCRLHKPLYRIDAILNAWKEVEEDARFSSWSLTVAACGEETENLKNLAKRLDLQRVVFTGFVSVEQLAQYYQEARVFVSVPESDATSISLLEAMSYGCLPVLSNLPANLEWVLDGVNGLVVEDVEKLGAALKNAMQNTAETSNFNDFVDFNRGVVLKKGLHDVNMKCFYYLYLKMLEKKG